MVWAPNWLEPVNFLAFCRTLSLFDSILKTGYHEQVMGKGASDWGTLLLPRPHGNWLGGIRGCSRIVGKKSSCVGGGDYQRWRDVQALNATLGNLSYEDENECALSDCLTVA